MPRHTTENFYVAFASPSTTRSGAEAPILIHNDLEFSATGFGIHERGPALRYLFLRVGSRGFIRSRRILIGTSATPGPTTDRTRHVNTMIAHENPSSSGKLKRSQLLLRRADTPLQLFDSSLAQQGLFGPSNDRPLTVATRDLTLFQTCWARGPNATPKHGHPWASLLDRVPVYPIPTHHGGPLSVG